MYGMNSRIVRDSEIGALKKCEVARVIGSTWENSIFSFPRKLSCHSLSESVTSFWQLESYYVS